MIDFASTGNVDQTTRGCARLFAAVIAKAIHDASRPLTRDELLANENLDANARSAIWFLFSPHSIFGVYAEAIGRVVEQARARGIVKPIVASLSGDVEVEEAARYLEERGIPSYPYAPERAVSALAALHRWARSAGLLPESDS